MSNYNSFEEAVEAAGNQITQNLVGIAERNLYRKAERLERNIREEMRLIARRMIQMVTGTGGEIPMPSYKPLSDAWADRKRYAGARAEFYYGITEAMARKAKGKRNDKARARRSAKSFVSYLGALQRSGFGSRALGDPTFQFYMGDTPAKFNVDKRQRITIRNEKGQFLKKLTAYDVPKLVMTVFPKLFLGSADFESNEANERTLIGQIWGNLDAQGQQQWYKVGSNKGIRGSARPVRPILTPVIHWYLNVGFKRAVNKAIRGS